jgi:hypothetical protein
MIREVLPCRSSIIFMSAALLCASKGWIPAAANHHLLVKKNKIILGSGPEENRWRPSIDVLFRSAAVAYNTRAIGVVLTGSLDDGTNGMDAIKRSGGITIVQDPNEAEYPDMPLSVLNAMEVDHCIPLSQMGDVIFDITQTKRKEKASMPARIAVVVYGTLKTVPAMCAATGVISDILIQKRILLLNSTKYWNQHYG